MSENSGHAVVSPRRSLCSGGACEAKKIRLKGKNMITQGNWTVQSLETAKNGYADWNTYCIRAANNCHLATVGNVDRFFEENALDNARLIAAAPDLLEALRALTAIVNGCRISKKEKERHLDNARTAIAKAEGDK
jgi:hypothetical protein